jgi:hypothetical protein
MLTNTDEKWDRLETSNELIMRIKLIDSAYKLKYPVIRRYELFVYLQSFQQIKLWV